MFPMRWWTTCLCGAGIMAMGAIGFASTLASETILSGGFAEAALVFSSIVFAMGVGIALIGVIKSVETPPGPKGSWRNL